MSIISPTVLEIQGHFCNSESQVSVVMSFYTWDLSLLLFLMNLQFLIIHWCLKASHLQQQYEELLTDDREEIEKEEVKEEWIG